MSAFFVWHLPDHGVDVGAFKDSLLVTAYSQHMMGISLRHMKKNCGRFCGNKTWVTFSRLLHVSELISTCCLCKFFCFQHFLSNCFWVFSTTGECWIFRLKTKLFHWRLSNSELPFTYSKAMKWLNLNWKKNVCIQLMDHFSKLMIQNGTDRVSLYNQPLV